MLDDWGLGPRGAPVVGPVPSDSAYSGLQWLLLVPRNSAVFGATERAPRTHAPEHTHDRGSPPVGADSKTFASKEEVAGWSVGNLSIDGSSQPSLWPPHVQVLSLPHAAEVCTRVCQAALQTEPGKRNGLWLLRRFYTSLQTFIAHIFCLPPYAIGNCRSSKSNSSHECPLT